MSNGPLPAPKLFATTIGFGEHLLVRGYLAAGIHGRDEILVVRAPPELGQDRQLEEAVKRFSEFLQAVRPGGPTVKKLELDPLNFEENVLTLLTEFLEAKRRGLSVVINPVAGLRALGLTLFYALTFVGGWMVLQHEVSGVVRVVEISPVRLDLRSEKEAILRAIGNSLDVRGIAARVGVSPPTVYRHLSALREAGFISANKDITLLGKIALILTSYRKI